MTKKQKAERLDSIINLILVAGFKLDTYGNYKRELDGRVYRIKLKSVNIRIERKAINGSDWFKVLSEPIVSVTDEALVQFFTKFVAIR